jgi:hypothetical protein
MESIDDFINKKIRLRDSCQHDIDILSGNNKEEILKLRFTFYSNLSFHIPKRMGRGDPRSNELFLNRKRQVLLECNKLLKEFDERYSIKETDITNTYEKYRFDLC